MAAIIKWFLLRPIYNHVTVPLTTVGHDPNLHMAFHHCPLTYIMAYYNCPLTYTYGLLPFPSGLYLWHNTNTQWPILMAYYHCPLIYLCLTTISHWPICMAYSHFPLTYVWLITIVHWPTYDLVPMLTEPLHHYILVYSWLTTITHGPWLTTITHIPTNYGLLPWPIILLVISYYLCPLTCDLSLATMTHWPTYRLLLLPTTHYSLPLPINLLLMSRYYDPLTYLWLIIIAHKPTTNAIQPFPTNILLMTYYHCPLTYY